MEKYEVLNTAYEYIGKLVSGIDEMNNKFYAGNENSGCEMLALISEGLEWLMNALDLLNDNVDTCGERSEIKEKANEVVEALENEDYILVADIFNYEINPNLNNINLKLNNLIDNIRE